MKLLTNLIFEPKGKHDPALAYSIKDTVMSADGSRVYFALQDVPAGIALADEDYWKLQIDLSDTKSSMDAAIADFANYARETGLRVKGETAVAAGNPVSFLPDAGSLLMPVTVLTPRQEGSGDPSPDNIRPFIGCTSVTLNHNLDAYTVQLGQTVYGGRFDWLAGKLTAEWGVYALTGADGARLTSTSTYNGKCFLSDVIPNMVGNSAALSGATSSHFTEGIWNNVVNMDAPFGKFSITTSNKIGIAFDGTIDEANAWLAAQSAAGTPVQVAWKLAAPIELQLTPHLISAADPEQINTLYGDGEIELAYVKPLHVSIEERVAAALAATE